MNALCWNCRGLGNPATVREVRVLTAKFAPAVLCLVETQLQNVRAEILAQSFGYDRSFAVGSSGRSGGLVIYWNDSIKLEVKGYSRYHIDVNIDDLGPRPWRLTCVYGEAQVMERYKTWDTLCSIAGTSDLPWLVLGDFNEVLMQSEHEGVNPRGQGQMDGFRDALDICGLADLGYTGRRWTFEKKVSGGTFTRVRLDRAVADTEWNTIFPFAEVVNETAACSDHGPIVLKLMEENNDRHQPKNFKYEVMWERHPELYAFVEGKWNSEQKASSAVEVQEKLKQLGEHLYTWDRYTFGSVKREIKQLMQQLKVLKDVPGRSGPSHLEIKVTDRLAELYHREEILHRQRSRVDWLTDGDKNTKYFQQRASMRRRKNRITALAKPDGQLTEDVAELESMTTEFYKDLYTSEGCTNMQEVLDSVPEKLTDEMRALLDADYTEKEVKTALYQMFPTKSPGPDGFPAHFFQKHWGVCGSEVTEAVFKIVKGQESAEGINQTFLVLIPKVKNPSLLSQFRPISLCNVLYKIASKVIANRLKQVLPEIISAEQSAFVPGRLITDNIIVAYECLHFMKRNRAVKHRHCALKLDMMKAYDRVEWDYLRAVMLKLGFSLRWVDIVMNLVSSVSYSVLFNGKKLEEFKPTKGIRQGDPISPYLFLLAAEGLSGLLKNLSESSQLGGIQVAPSAPPVNHLLFADDSLLFFKATGGGATEVSNLLDKYCQASGQRINSSKSSIFFSKGCPANVKTEIKGILNVPNETLKDKYLGLPSDIGTSKFGAFKYLKDRLWSKVKGWIEKSLSSAGKEVLVKSVAQAVPVFSMSCFKLPRGLCEHLNKLIRQFWWGSKEGKRKPAWVSWKSMTQPKYMGGLGFRDFELFNLALLARQAWRILQQPESLCARLLKAIYFPQGTILNAELGSRPSQVWRAILEGRDVMSQGIIKRIGDGASTRIWTENWIPRCASMRPFACLSADPPSMVSEIIDHTNATWNRQVLEQVFIAADTQAILSIPVCTVQMEDYWAWNYEKNGNFSVRSAYRMLADTKRRRENWLEGNAGSSDFEAESKAWTSLWSVQVPGKIRNFLWRLAKHSIPTEDIRHTRNMADGDRCQLCGMQDSWRHSLLE
jgi:hypothetical protein